MRKKHQFSSNKIDITYKMIITRIHRLKHKQEPRCLTGNEGIQAVYDEQQGAAA